MSLSAERVQRTQNGFRYFKVRTDEKLDTFDEYEICKLCHKPTGSIFYVIPWYNDARQVYCESCFANWLTWGDIQDDLCTEKMKSDVISGSFGHTPPIKNYSSNPNEFYWDRKKHGDPTW